MADLTTILRGKGPEGSDFLFAMLLLDAALNAGRINLARALAAERLGRRPDNPWTADAYDRAFAL